MAGRRWAIAAAVAVVVVLVVVAVIVVTASDTDDNGSTTTTSSTTTTEPTTTSTSTTTTSTSTTTTVPAPTTVPPDPAGRVITRTSAGVRAVSLTFDGGSDVGNTGQILDILAANGIRATFGITGRFAERYPDAVHRMAAEGHQLVNHSYDHSSFTGRSTGRPALTAEERVDQLVRAEAALTAAAGVGTNGWFRPPYGDIDETVVQDVAGAGWPTVVMWTVDSLGWRQPGVDAVIERCVQRAEPGAIYLFHVGAASDDAAALQPIIDALRADGYSFEATAYLPLD